MLSALRAFAPGRRLELKTVRVTANYPAVELVLQRWTAVASYLSLLKLRIVAMLILVAGAAAVVAYRGFPSWERLTLLFVAGGLASMGASLLNNYFDRDIDALMVRTQNRPLPSGRVGKPVWVLASGICLIIMSLPFSLALNYHVALYTLLGAIVYGTVYTLVLKRHTWLNVVIGGTAGSFAALAGWSIMRPELNGLALIMAALIFAWTPLHFWNFALVHLGDYRNARVPMLPVNEGEGKTSGYIFWTSIIIFLLSLMPYLMGYSGRVYLLVALGMSFFLYGNFSLIRRPTRDKAWRNYKFSGIYLSGLFLALAIDSLL